MVRSLVLKPEGTRKRNCAGINDMVGGLPERCDPGNPFFASGRSLTAVTGLDVTAYC